MTGTYVTSTDMDCRCERSGVAAPQRRSSVGAARLVDRRELVLAVGEAMGVRAVEGDDPGADGAGLVVVLVDIDDFRRVNDDFGFAVGDQVIDRLAVTLLAAARQGDVVAHLSGSSFGVCCGRLDESEVEGYVDALRSALGRPMEVDGHRVEVRTSVGVARPVTTWQADQLIQQADLALSRAKELGGDRACTYDEGLRDRVLRRVEVEALVRRAVFLQEIELHYQPILELEGRAVVGAEALVRLADEEGVRVPALEVIDLAERTGLMVDLGALILWTACREAAGWQRAEPDRHLTVSVNVSARQLEDDRLPVLVEEILKETGLEASRLCIEVTETVLMADTERSVHLLTQLKALGVSVAADDFGTGYCSLAYLKRFPLDAVKADLSFVAGLPHSVEDVAVVAAIMGIARALGLRVVAEGVEHIDQLDELDRLGCGFGQGHLWSRALPAIEFAELVAASPEMWGPEDHHRASLRPVRRSRRVKRRRPLPAASIDLALRSLAHELRNPLTVVGGYASLLQHRDVDLDQISEELLRAVRRMDRLIGQIDDVRAADTGRLALHRAETNLVALAEEAVAEVQVGSGVSLVLVRPVYPLKPVKADTDRVRQALDHLLVNAVQHSPTGGTVEVTVEGGDEWVELAVVDDGPGVSPAELDLIFRKFGRVDHSQPGSGLGLYLARSIARAHGGDVVHRGRGPSGSVFAIRLPTSGSASAA